MCVCARVCAHMCVSVCMHSFSVGGGGGRAGVEHKKEKRKYFLETKKEWEVTEGWILIGDFKMEDAAEGVK